MDIEKTMAEAEDAREARIAEEKAAEAPEPAREPEKSPELTPEAEKPVMESAAADVKAHPVLGKSASLGDSGGWEVRDPETDFASIAAEILKARHG